MLHEGKRYKPFLLRLFFRKDCLVCTYLDSMNDSTFNREVIELMSYGKIEADRKRIWFNFFKNELLQGSPKFLARVIGFDLEAAYHQSFKSGKFSRSFKMPEHTVDTI